MMRNNLTILVLLLNACLGSTITHADDVWTNYFVNPGQVTSMTRHRQYLWCGTEFGLYRWDTTDMTYEVFTRPGGRFQNDIKDIAVDSQGLVWVGFSESGVAAFDGSGWINEYLPETEDIFRLTGVEVDDNDTAWIAASFENYMEIVNARLYSYDGEWHSSRPSHDQLHYQNISRFTIAPDGSLWSIIDQVLFQYNRETWYAYEIDIHTYDLVSDQSGGLWMWDYRSNAQTGSLAFCLFTYSGNTITDIPVPPTFLEPYWKNICCDANNSIWVATEGGGLLEVKNNEPSVVNLDDGSHWLTTVMVDDDGSIWAGRTDGGISRFVDGEWVDYNVMHGSDNGNVYDFTKDRAGMLWATASFGISKYENSEWIMACPATEIPLYADTPYKLLFTTDNTMWVSGESQENTVLLRYTGDGFVTDSQFQDINGIVPGNDNDFYIGESGLWHYHPDSGTAQFLLEPNSDSSASPVFVEPNDAVWCSNLCRYDGSWTSFISVFRMEPWEAYYQQTHINGYGIDSIGTLWLSVVHHNSGNTITRSSYLFKYENNSLTRFHLNPVNELALKTIDSNDTAWFSVTDYHYGTYPFPGGIMTFRDSVTTFYTDEKGLLSNTVNDIVEHDGGIWVATDIGICSRELPTAVEETPPQVFDTVRNFPNPFNPSTTIRYSVETEAHTTVEIFGVTGQRVATLIDRIQPPGNYDVQFDGAGLPSGLYFVRVTTGGRGMAGKMMLVK